MSEKQKALDSGAPDAAEQRRIQGALFAEEVKVRPAFPTRFRVPALRRAELTELRP